jgi:hypothetical protein
MHSAIRKHPSSNGPLPVEESRLLVEFATELRMLSVADVEGLMTDPGQHPNTSDHQRQELALRWYQSRLGFWQAIWGTLITGAIAVAIPASVEAYKASIEREIKQLDIALKGKEVELKAKEIEGKRLDADQQYISRFLTEALNPDIEARIRLSQYFSHVSGDQSKASWAAFFRAVEARRNLIRSEINAKRLELDKLMAKSDLTVEEASRAEELRREIDWYVAETGYKVR